MMRKRVAVIGGGYGGLKAVSRLARRKDLDIVLIDRHPYHFLQTEGYDLIAGKIPFDETIITLRSWCAGIGKHIIFMHNIVKKIDFDTKTIFCEGNTSVSYDYLIIAAGAVTNFFENIEGLRDHAVGTKSLHGSLMLKEFFEQELYKRLECDTSAKVCYNIVIVGAGLSGVEIAAQMQSYFNRYHHVNSLTCGSLQIHLIDGEKSILVGMNPSVIEVSTRRLEKLGVILRLGANIEKVDPNKVILANGRYIGFDFMVFTGGIIAAPFVQKLPSLHNGKGQIIVNKYMQINDHPEVFAIGDAAELRGADGEVVMPTAQSAEASGLLAAKNICAMIKGSSLHATHIRIKGLAIALGGRYAIIDMGKFHIYGFLAYFAKKVIEKSYKWPLKWRSRKGFAKIVSYKKFKRR